MVQFRFFAGYSAEFLVLTGFSIPATIPPLTPLPVRRLSATLVIPVIRAQNRRFRCAAACGILRGWIVRVLLLRAAWLLSDQLRSLWMWLLCTVPTIPAVSGVPTGLFLAVCADVRSRRVRRTVGQIRRLPFHPDPRRSYSRSGADAQGVVVAARTVFRGPHN